MENRMQVKPIISILVLLILTGCGLIPPKSIVYNGGKQAVSSAYHLSKKPFHYDDLIDTTAIYFTSEVLTVSNKKGEILYKDVESGRLFRQF
jgi:hypothetical protein